MCKWNKRTNGYATECGHVVTVRQRGGLFCPYCGEKIEKSRRKMKCDLEDCFNCPYDDCILDMEITDEEEKEKRRAYNRQYYQRHRDALNNRAKDYYRKNADSINEKARQKRKVLREWE